MNETGNPLAATAVAIRRRLVAQCDPRGFWEGRLSSSALATAIAVVALAQADRRTHAAAIANGLRWIAAHANADGGWGDSPQSPTNLTATVLCWGAMSLAESGDAACGRAVRSAEEWLRRAAGSVDPDSIRAAVLRRYGDDRTFAAPILVLCALTGRLGSGRTAWERVPQLPFELALLPHRVFRLVRLSVVSYALPALIAIGLARHRNAPCGCPVKRAVRDAAADRVLRIAARMQPSNGGFEEATPLTAFIVMSLCAAGLGGSGIVGQGVSFLCQSVRSDGSWPIDTNLATWVTTLSVNALAHGVSAGACLDPDRKARIRTWLLNQQYHERHPLTFGKPGGWAWTDLPGGMPDADDTSGALLALRCLGPVGSYVLLAASRGAGWLMDLQNSDGGIPTFSRGWGRLPFDRSCPDITAHALHAFSAWRDALPDGLKRRVAQATDRGLEYLRVAQGKDGSWTPLWFGNQSAPNEENRTYGTARVVIALDAMAAFGEDERVGRLLSTGLDWLRGAQGEDGGWGGCKGVAPSIEETALAATAMARSVCHRDAAVRGLRWLCARLASCDGEIPEMPIGLYFARLWYSEQLYPVVFSAWAFSVAWDCGLLDESA